MKVRMLTRLLALRQMSEKEAFEAVIRCGASFREAEQESCNTRVAVTRHASESRERENRLVEALLGQPAPLSRIDGFYSALDAMSLTASRLRNAEEAAKAALSARQSELDAARETFRKRQQATIRLDMVVKTEIACGAKRRLAHDEAAQEDQWRLGAGDRMTEAEHYGKL